MYTTHNMTSAWFGIGLEYVSYAIGFALLIDWSILCKKIKLKIRLFTKLIWNRINAINANFARNL